MTLHKITARVVARAPAEVVWRAMTDWGSQHEWMLGTRVAVARGDGRSVGSRLYGFTGILDVGFLDVLEIVAWEPPRVCRVRHLGRVVRGRGEFSVEPLDGGCVVTWTEWMPPPLGWGGWVLGWGMRWSLRRLVGGL